MPRLHPPLAITAALLAWGLAPPSLAPGWSGRVREAMQSDQRSSGDLERMERGYYEILNGSGPRIDPKTSPPPTDFGPLTLPVADVREYVLKPSLATRHRGATWTTNARGMRDRDYPIDKPAGTYRIALAGDSIGAGWGVDDGQGFEPIWERSLNLEWLPLARDTRSHGPPWECRPRRSALTERTQSVQEGIPTQSVGTRWEIWNHAVPGLAPGQRWEHFSREGWASHPDLVVFQGSPADFGWDDRKLRSLLPKGIGWDVDSYREGLAIANVRPGDDEESYRKALRPHREAILAGVYRAVAEACRSKGVESVWLLLPRVGKPTPTPDRVRLVELAREAGFTHIVDLSDAFDGLDPASLAIGPDDFHPNATGHEILARRLDEALREHLNPGGDRR